MSRTWRDMYRPIIREVIAATHGKTEKEIRKALRDAYDEVDGMRQYWPYKVWCDEVRTQRGLKKRKPSLADPMDPNQAKLF